MTDLRAAALQALEALDTLYRTLTPETPLAKSLKQRADTLRAALEEPAQDHFRDVRKMVQEPVAWQWLDTGTFRKKLPKTAERCAWNPLYAAPPQRPPLTDEEIKNAVENCGIDTKFIPRTCVLVARAIEQAHGIRSKT